MGPVTMENVLESSFGEASSTIRAVYKKTVFVKQYETEVVELETTLKLEKQVTSAERMLICAMLQAQLEYEAYCQLAFKGYVTESELNQRKQELEQGLTAIKGKAERVLDKPLDDYFKIQMK